MASEEEAVLIFEARGAGLSERGARLAETGLTLLPVDSTCPCPAPAALVLQLPDPRGEMDRFPRLPSGTIGRLPVVVCVPATTSVRRERPPRVGLLAWSEGPLESSELAALLSGMIASSRKSASVHRKALVADASQKIGEFLSWLLGAAGYEVAVAREAEEAFRLTQAASPPYDYAMVDLGLPGRPSNELIAEMKRQAPATVVVMMAGETPPETISKGYAAGGYTLVRKPFKASVLIPFFSMMENECEEWKQVLAWRAEEAALPFYRRAHRWVLEAMDAPPNSPSKQTLTTIAFIVLATVLAVLGIWIASEFTKEPPPEEGSYAPLEGPGGVRAG